MLTNCLSSSEITHSTDFYENPSEYQPARFLDANWQIIPELEVPIQDAFGFGRRVCPGRHLALESMWILMARIIATHNIGKELDANGKEIEPVIKFTGGVTTCVQFLLRPYLPYLTLSFSVTLSLTAATSLLVARSRWIKGQNWATASRFRPHRSLDPRVAPALPTHPPTFLLHGLLCVFILTSTFKLPTRNRSIYIHYLSFIQRRKYSVTHTIGIPVQVALLGHVLF